MRIFRVGVEYDKGLGARKNIWKLSIGEKAKTTLITDLA